MTVITWDLTKTISDDELRTTFKKNIDPSEDILKVWVYKEPLGEGQFTNVVLFHAYTVLKTNQWYWSFEKNREGLTVQRAKNFEAVAKRYRQKERTSMDSFGLQLIKEDKGEKTMNQLVDYLYDENELNQTYNWVSSNCKNFASKIFNFVARSERWNHIGIF